MNSLARLLPDIKDRVVKQCAICSQTFDNDRALLSHIQTHSEDRSHTCVVCGRSFTHSCNLRKHLVVHSTTKDYKCPICYKAFSLPQPCKRHVQLLHGIDPKTLTSEQFINVPGEFQPEVKATPVKRARKKKASAPPTPEVKPVVKKEPPVSSGDPESSPLPKASLTGPLPFIQDIWSKMDSQERKSQTSSS